MVLKLTIDAKIMMRTSFILLGLAFAATSCVDKPNDNIQSSEKRAGMFDSAKYAGSQVIEDSTFQVKNRVFVTSDYLKRNEGLPWMAVQLDSIAKDTIAIKLISGQQKENCNYFTHAFELEKGIYRSVNTDPIVLFTLDGETLHIGTPSEKDDKKLSFYCSDNSSFIGDYTLLHEPLDTISTDSIK